MSNDETTTATPTAELPADLRRRGSTCDLQARQAPIESEARARLAGKAAAFRQAADMLESAELAAVIAVAVAAGATFADRVATDVCESLDDLLIGHDVFGEAWDNAGLASRRYLLSALAGFIRQELGASSCDETTTATPTRPPANVLHEKVRGVEYPLAVGINRFGHHEVVAADVDNGLAMFMHYWRPWCGLACILEDQVAFVGWVVPS